jgi:hypothetical protein
LRAPDRGWGLLMIGSERRREPLRWIEDDPAPTRGGSVLESIYVPGTLVRHPDRPEWGVGMVQTAINNKITVNFEEQGKVVLDGNTVKLEVVKPG